MASLAAANLLANETSPYLLQHKDNPVHWRAWGPDALAEAAHLNKPIYLSSGYSSCHWCHVMAKESFEDPETAKLLNDNFVCIKIDREERPDLDQIFQASLQSLGQSGGWPTSMFLTSKAEPFAGATYIPKEEQPQFNRPAFKTVLNNVLELYRDKPDQVEINVKGLRQSLQNAWAQNRTIDGQLTPLAVEQASRRICQMQDVFSGGITGAQKFANVPHLENMWRGFLRGGARQYQSAVDVQLFNMCQGGIFDHLGGGFARYSVDELWLIPHFEKMLNDNALLIDIMASVWQENRAPLFKARIEETIGWLQREMVTPEGAFAAAQDSDTDGQEGAYYVWTAEEVEKVLGTEDAKLFRTVYDVRDTGNWDGKSVLHRLRNFNVEPMAEGRLNGMRQKLLDVRLKRTRPLLDDKILSDWNGMVIHALTKAADVLNRIEWQAIAVRAFWFVADKMSDGSTLSHSYRAGRKSNIAIADDYTFMIRAALALFETTGDKRYLQKAQTWTSELDNNYWDTVNGGYAQTSQSAEPLFVRPRQAADTSNPNANGIMIWNLATMHFLTGEAHYRDRANAIISAFSQDAAVNVSGYASLFNSMDSIMRVIQIVIIGERQSADTNAMRDVLRRISIPNKVVQIVASAQDLHPAHPAFGKAQVQGRTTVYLCNATQCSNPVVDPNQLEMALKTRTVSAPS